MKSRFLFVVDTNIFVSALLSKNSFSQKCVKKAAKLGDFLLSKETLDEIKSVLSRKKFEKYITSDDRVKFIEFLILKSNFVTIKEKVKICRDEKDDKILELALNGKADFILTGDKDLLVLNPFQEIKILSPRKFVEMRI
ncbi:MAG: putative toxin-antitoxin system toxin component, PIN family [Calditrichaeota bacterium]|nr:MAG: putative toxin-antitoxin system toxin component, PIN family [Calditrichota bacterium]